MGGKSSGGKSVMQVAQYRMSVHVAFCTAVDSIRKIMIGEKEVWRGERTVNSQIAINNVDLFGGIRKEGGVSGHAHVYLGGPTQTLSAYIKSKLTGMPGIPAFRGLASIFFTAGDGNESQVGFYWSANSPYLRPIWVQWFRRPKGLSTATAVVDNNLGTVNPAHIIYECMTNTEWGMGTPTSYFTVSDWNSVAQVLYDEGLGLAMRWTQQSEIQEFINDVLNHIDASLVRDPATQKYKLKLVRDDYDPATVPLVDVSHAKITRFQRKAWGETTNQINVTYTNPENEQEETVTVQDLGNIAAQGEIIADNPNYYGIRDAGLATRLAHRDLKAASTPLAIASAELDHTFWNLTEGDVVRVTWPEYEIENLLMRLTRVNRGTARDSKISVDLVEDVFGFAASSYTAPGTAWQDPSEPPAPVPDNLFEIFTLPYALQLTIDPAEDGQEALAYPQVRAGVLATQEGSDTSVIVLQRFGADAAGNMRWTNAANLTPLGYQFSQALVAEVRTTIAMPIPTYGTTRMLPGEFIYIGNPASFNEALGASKFNRAEIALVESIDEVSQTAVIRRGVLDTIPRPWPLGTPIWILDSRVPVADRLAIWSETAVATYRLVPQTSQGSLDPALANVETHALTARPFQPFRPANVKINGADPTPAPLPTGPITFTWSNRNRFAETSQMLAWDDPGVTVEPTQRTVVEFWTGAQGTGTLVSRKTSTGESLTFTGDDNIINSMYWVMYSETDHPDAGTLTSYSWLTGQTTINLTGFGYNFGNDFGGPQP